MEFVQEEQPADAEPGVKAEPEAGQMIDAANPLVMRYCPTCSMPPEFCEYGTCFDKCLPWIVQNCPEVLKEDVLARALGSMSLDGEGKAEGEVVEEKKKPRGGGAAAPKKAVVLDTKVFISRVQRQKRKYVTVIGGLDSVPDLKIKDATKVFGKKFSSGASVNEGPTGQKEVVIQGDVAFDLPALLMSEFKVPASSIFFVEDGSLRAYA